MGKRKTNEPTDSGKSQDKERLASKGKLGSKEEFLPEDKKRLAESGTEKPAPKDSKENDSDLRKKLKNLQVEVDALRAQNAELQAEVEKQRRLKSVIETPDQLSLILKHLSDAVIVSDNTGEVLLFNDSAERMFGGWRPGSPDQWSQTYQIYEPDGKELYPNDQLPLMRAIQGYEVKQAEMVVKRTGISRDVYASINASPLKDLDGNTIGGVAVARDISDSIEAKRRLENSERLFENFMNNNPALAFMKDADGRYVYVNDSFVKLFGRSRAEMEGIYDEDYLPADVARSVRENDLKVMSSRQVAEFTERVPTPDGVDREWLVFKFPFENIYGNLHVGGIALDITERKKSMFNMLTEMVPSVLWITDASGGVEYFNRGWYELTGATEEQSLGTAWADFIEPLDRERVLAVWNTAVESGDVYEIEYRFIRAQDNESRWFLVRGLPLRRADGTIERWFGTCTDIHEQRRLKEELEQSMVELALARDEAQSASRIKSEFVANISHELRTPMNGVLGMVDILLKSELTPKTREHALTIQRAGRDLLQIINEILDFSKIEAGKLTLELSPFNLKKLIEGVAEILLPIAEERRLKLDSYIDSDIPLVLIGDPLRIRQIILNLVGNALKFTHVGEVFVSATMIGVTEKMVQVRFDVSDTGIGISNEQVDSLFEAFFQSDGSVSRKYGGTGLGLAICKTLVEMMEGTISVASELGRGSTFSFELSLEVAAEQSDEHLDTAAYLTPVRLPAVTPAQLQSVSSGQTQSASASQLQSAHAGQSVNTGQSQSVNSGQSQPANVVQFASSDQSRSVNSNQLQSANQIHQESAAAQIKQQRAKPNDGRLHVLVADDHPINQQVAQLLLEDLGCTVDVVGNGADAVNAARSKEYDLIILDCQMPEMDGYEACQLIREHQQAVGTRVPIVAMTAFATEGSREECIAAGMDDYVSKPIEEVALKRVLRVWVEGR